MARLLVTCWLVALLLGAWTDVAFSKKGKGKPSGGGWGMGSHRQPSYPRQPGYPQNPSYPHNPGYPHNPSYPHNPGYPHNPSYPHNPGWGQGYNPSSGGSYHNQKPWKPPKSKTNFKHVAGAAAAGAVVGGLGGYAMGRVMSGMHYHFDSPDEYRWWNQNAARYPSQVYYRDYNSPVSQDVFVADCFNITVTEYNIGPAAKKNVSEAGPALNQTEAEMETKVVTKVIREMCVQQYREYRLASGIRLHLPDASLAALLLLTLFAMH
ncbi:PRIO protein, partial [Podargus strigoides]|nr:PRIO protein [Podargus strigoides]